MIRALSLITAAFLLASCDGGLSSQTNQTSSSQLTEVAPSTPAADPVEVVQAVRELESWDAIIEVMHDESLAVQWTIGVRNDGSKRYGLAESVCIELSDRGLQHDRTWVRVVDRQAVISNGGDFRAASLGGVRCSTGDRIDP